MAADRSEVAPKERWAPSRDPGATADDEIDLGQLWRALVQGWRWIAGGLALGASIALLIVLFSRPVFQSDGSLYLGEVVQGNNLPSLSGLGFLSDMLQSTGMETQLEILRSRDLVDRVILQTGLNTRVRRAGQGTIRFWRWRFGGADIRRYAPRPGDLSALYAEPADPALARTWLRVRFADGGRYEVYAGDRSILSGVVEQPAVGGGLRLVLHAEVAGTVPPAGAAYDLWVDAPAHVYRELLRSGDLSISAPSAGGVGDQKTQIANISFLHTQPYMAQRFVDQLMADYLAQTLHWTTDQATSTYNYLSDQLQKIRESLATADERLAEYQKRSGVVAPTENAKVMIKQMADYQMQRTAAALRLQSLKQIETELRIPNAPLQPYLLSQVDDRVLDGLSSQLAGAEAELAKLREEYTDAAPQVAQAQAQIAKIKSTILQYIANQRSLAVNNVASIDRVIGKFDAELRALPEAALKITSLSLSADVLGKLYMYLLQKQEEAAISKAVTVSKNRVLDTALARDRPVSPSARYELALGAFLGLFLGTAFVLGRSLLTPSFRSDDEVRALFPDVPVYAVLPHLARKRGSRSAPAAGGFVAADPRTPFAEAIRILRSNLYLSLPAEGHHVLLVASSGPGEGKSMVSSHLGVVLAEDGKRVLLVDADLRKPHLHGVFCTPQEPGLSAVLTGRTAWQEAVRPTDGLTLELLAAGSTPPNPAELVGSKAFGELLVQIREHYDFVLVDGPPFPVVGDTLMIARHVDRVLSVVRVQMTRRKEFHEHVRDLAKNGHSLGLIINDVRTGQGYGYGYGSEPAQTWRSRLRRLLKR